AHRGRRRWPVHAAHDLAPAQGAVTGPVTGPSLIVWVGGLAALTQHRPSWPAGTSPQLLVQPAVLLICRDTGRDQVWPAGQVQPGGAPGVIRVGIIAAVAADELEGVGVAAFWSARHDPGRLAAQHQRPAVGALTTGRHAPTTPGDHAAPPAG